MVSKVGGDRTSHIRIYPHQVYRKDKLIMYTEKTTRVPSLAQI